MISASLLVIIVTVVVSLIGLQVKPEIITKGVFRPYYLLRNREYYTLITSGLLHASGSHLLFNMLTLYFFAPQLEREIGTTQFAVLYFAALILSEARTWLQQRNNPNYASLGASGAVSAVLFASIVYFPYQSLYIIPIPIPIPAPLFAVGYLVYSWYSSRYGRDNINHTAHIDGAIVGLLFVALTNPGVYRQLLALIG